MMLPLAFISCQEVSLNFEFHCFVKNISCLKLFFRFRCYVLFHKGGFIVKDVIFKDAILGGAHQNWLNPCLNSVIKHVPDKDAASYTANFLWCTKLTLVNTEI